MFVFSNAFIFVSCKFSRSYTHLNDLILLSDNLTDLALLIQWRILWLRQLISEPNSMLSSYQYDINFELNSQNWCPSRWWRLIQVYYYVCCADFCPVVCCVDLCPVHRNYGNALTSRYLWWNYVCVFPRTFLSLNKLRMTPISVIL
jgi:hypothetical protein